MKFNGLLVVLTVTNLALLCMLLARGQAARAGDELGVLRGRGLEIVDERGKVRASITIFPEDHKFKSPEGRPYPETVLLRLINANGAPNVKLGASNTGSGLGLGGETNPTYIQVIADKDATFLNMLDKNGKKQTLKPGSRNGPTPYSPAKQ